MLSTNSDDYVLSTNINNDNDDDDASERGHLVMLGNWRILMNQITNLYSYLQLTFLTLNMIMYLL